MPRRLSTLARVAPCSSLKVRDKQRHSEGIAAAMGAGDTVRLMRPVFAQGRELPAGAQGRIVQVFACLPSAEVAILHENETLILPITLVLLEPLSLV